MPLPDCRCLPGQYPNWKALGPIVAAARTWAGESDDLRCWAGLPIIDQLRGLYCATLVLQGGGGPTPPPATLIASFDIADPETIDSFSRAIAAGFTGDGDPFTYQREAAVDILRSVHYQDSFGPLVLLEEIPTECILVAPGIPTVDVEGTDYQASYTGIPVTASLLRYEVGLDAPGSWTPNGTNLTYDSSGADGTHTFRVRAVSTSGVPGETATSDPFDLVGAELDPSDYGTPLSWHVGDDVAAGSVSSWPFRTYGANFTQATGAAQPVAVAGDLNGHTVIRFDGSNDFMSGTPISASGVTAFYVLNFNAADPIFCAMGTIANNDFWLVFTEGYFGAFRTTRLESYPAVMPSSGAHLFTIISTGSTYRVRIDGVDQGAQAAAFNAGDAYTIGADSTGTVKFFAGDFAEELVMDGEISDPDLSEMEGILMDKYGIV